MEHVFAEHITILCSYLMGVQAIYQNIFLEVPGKTNCSIALGQRPSVIEHFGLSKYRGKHCLIYCLYSHYITVLLPIYDFLKTD